MSPAPKTQSNYSDNRHVAGGAVQMLAAQAFNVPLGILTNVILTRTLGPDAFGLFVLAFAFLAWFEIVTVRSFGRTSIKLIASTDDWKNVASGVLRLQLAIGLVGGVTMYGAAPLLSSLAMEPLLTPYLKIIAFQIPLSAMVRAHESTLLGLRSFGGRALLMLTHGVVRLVLVFGLLGVGLSLSGAILASIGAAAAQILVARLVITIPIRGQWSLPMQALSRYALPLFVYTIAIRLYMSLDVVVVQVLFTNDVATGLYGAAKTLMTMPGMISVVISPLLLAVLSRSWKENDNSGIQGIVLQALRLHALMLPLIAAVAGTSAEILLFLFGSEYIQAAPIMAWLVFAGLASMFHSTITASLAAIDQPEMTVWVTVPLIPLFIIGSMLNGRAGYLYEIAALNTLLLTGSGIVAYAWLARKTGTSYPLLAILRSGTISLGVYVLAWTSQQWWPTEGPLILAKLALLVAIIAVLLFVSREITVQDFHFFLNLARSKQRDQ